MSLKQSFLFGAAMLATSFAIAQTTTKTPLFESFSSSTCAPCAPGNVNLEGLLNQAENEDKFTSLKYQMSSPGTGDPYFTAEAGSRYSFYGVSSLPRLEVDGGFDASPSSLTQSEMDAAAAIESPLDLEAYFQVNEGTQTVTIQVTATALQEIESSGGLFLHCAIFEKETTGNIKTNGESEFENVMKKLVPGIGGTYLGGLDEDEVLTFDLEYTFNGDYILPTDATDPVDHAVEHSVEEFSDLGVVVWVQRSSTHEIYQSAYAAEGMAGISEYKTDAFVRLSIHPNPTQDMAMITYSTVTDAGDVSLLIHDFAGKLVLEQIIPNNGSETITHKLDTEKLENGMYFVTLSTKLGLKTEKLNVLH